MPGGRMRTVVLVVVGSVALACSGVEVRPGAATPASVEARPAPPPPVDPRPAVEPAAAVRVEELDYAWTGAARGDDGKYAIETTALRGREPGNRVTVLPLDVDAAPFVLPVAKLG